METIKTALIFGVTGQDGLYLSLLLLEKGYEVVGVHRRSSTDNTQRLEEVKRHENFTLVEGDILDTTSVSEIIGGLQPDEIYNLAAQSHVATSFKQPAFTFQVDAVGVLNILESIRLFSPQSKFYQASTSEMFGNNCSDLETNPMSGYAPAMRWQDEGTPFAPRSPYAVAKMAAHNLCFTYRESYGLFTCCGILFNHESEQRGLNFVTRKVSNYVAGLVARRWREMGRVGWRNQCYRADEVDPLALGNLDSRRDWGHAEDYVYAMWLMLQQEKPDDYVVATGETRSIRDLLDAAFGYVGIEDWSAYVYQDPEFYRPAEVDYLCGNPEKAKRVLGWEPKVTFQELVERMVDFDVEKKKEDAVLLSR